MHIHHDLPEIKMKCDLNFSAIAHSNKQKLISWQISIVVFSNALMEMLLIKLGDKRVLYTLYS